MSDVTFTAEEQKTLKALKQTDELYKAAIGLIQRSMIPGTDSVLAVQLQQAFGHILQQNQAQLENLERQAQSRSNQKAEAKADETPKLTAKILKAEKSKKTASGSN